MCDSSEKQSREKLFLEYFSVSIEKEREHETGETFSLGCIHFSSSSLLSRSYPYQSTFMRSGFPIYGGGCRDLSNTSHRPHLSTLLDNIIHLIPHFPQIPTSLSPHSQQYDLPHFMKYYITFYFTHDHVMWSHIYSSFI